MGTKRFSPKRNFTKKNIQQAPTDKPILYELLNNAGENIYTGISKRGEGQDRLEDHLPGNKDPIPGAAGFRVKQMPSIDRARTEEKIIIQKEHPKHNKQP